MMNNKQKDTYAKMHKQFVKVAIEKEIEDIKQEINNSRPHILENLLEFGFLWLSRI